MWRLVLGVVFGSILLLLLGAYQLQPAVVGAIVSENHCSLVQDALGLPVYDCGVRVTLLDDELHTCTLITGQCGARVMVAADRAHCDELHARQFPVGEMVRTQIVGPLCYVEDVWMAHARAGVLLLACVVCLCLLWLLII